MYGKNDLRTTLAAPTKEPAPITPYKGSSYGRFYEEKAVETDALCSTWYCRGQTMVVAFSKARAGAVLSRAAQLDEYVLLIPEKGASAEIKAGDETQVVHGPTVVFIPPGKSSIKALTDGDLWQFITTRNSDVAAKCSNAAEYSEADPNVAPYEPWPDPVGGYRLRAYSGETASTPGRFGRLYRGATIMVNFGSGRPGLRDPTNLSPHHHVGFEQYSVATAGDFIHHLRWPWTSDSSAWKEDEHARCASPSVAIIPPPSTHTSQGIAEGLNRLCDVFCPPRWDFSLREGWVLNADEYPMPDKDPPPQSGGGE